MKENWSGLFKRRASSLESLDGLRCIALLWVISYHSIMKIDSNADNGAFLNGWFLCFARNGDLGVDIFFVLSGFLISYILLREC